MKLHEQVLPRPTPAAPVSPSQSAELKLLLSGVWPPLKPLPVFKYETPDYRASIEFDKLRGDWLCRKTTLPSNALQELRGGLTEIVQSIPPARAESQAEPAPSEHLEQELEKDAARRQQSMQEWLETFADGQRYSELRAFLTQCQQAEIDQTLRLTLTARQLQCCPKNISVVFHALSTAGGTLATLIEIAQHKKNQNQNAQPEAAQPQIVQVGPAEPEPAETQPGPGVGDAGILAGSCGSSEGEGIHTNPLDSTQPEWELAPVEEHGPPEVLELIPVHNRRLYPRITPLSSTQVALANSQTATILNIGEQGMALAAEEALATDDSLPILHLQLPSSISGIELSAQIVWLADSNKTAGLRFVDLTNEARNQIQSWLAAENSTPPTEAVQLPTPPPAEAAPIPANSENTPAEIKNVVAESPIESAAIENVPAETILPKKERPAPYKLIDDLEFSDDAAPPQSEDPAPLQEISPTNLPPLLEDLPQELRRAPAFTAFASKSRRSLHEFSPALNTASEHVIELSGKQLASYALVFVLAISVLAAGITVGTGPLEKFLSSTERYIATISAKPHVPPSRASSTTAPPSNQQAANTNPAPLHPTNSNPTPEPATSAVPPPQPKPSPTPESIPPHNSSSAPIAPQPTTPEPAYSSNTPATVIPAPTTPASPKPTPVIGVTPHSTQPSSILVTLPARGDKPFRVTFPEKAISASTSIAMASELSLIVTPQPGAAPKPARLQTGPLIYYVWPRYSAKGNRYGTSQTIKVRATISPLGQVQSIKFVDGSSALLRATTSALQAWRYKPTLLNNTPVQVQQLITIEFRPSQYLTQARRPHPLQQK